VRDQSAPDRLPRRIEGHATSSREELCTETYGRVDLCKNIIFVWLSLDSLELLRGGHIEIAMDAVAAYVRDEGIGSTEGANAG
jgi:hypothetical protein